MKSIQLWFSEYNESHLHPTNKTIHWICVPAIFFSIMGLLAGIHLYVLIGISLFVWLFYLRLDIALSVAMLVMMGLFFSIIYFVPMSIWVYVAIFVVAWIGQFYGHKVEGKKPSFFKDLQFLLIGPAWCMDAWLAKLLPNWTSRQSISS